MTAIEVGPADAGKTCPYCRFPLKVGTSVERCDVCQTMHHTECWADGAGCAVLGCTNAGSVTALPAAAATAPIRVDVPAPSAPTPGTAASRQKRRRRPRWGIVAPFVLLSVAGIAAAAVVLTQNGSGGADSTRTADQIAAAMTPVEQSATSLVAAVKAGKTKADLKPIGGSARQLANDAATARREIGGIAGVDAATTDAFGATLREVERYGQLTAGAAAAPTSSSVAVARNQRAVAVASVAGLKRSQPTLASVIPLPEVDKLMALANAPKPRPAQTTGGTSIAGRFASVDHLQRCVLTDEEALCGSGPSGRRVQLKLGEPARENSAGIVPDRGEPNMAMGRSITNSAGTIRCDSSSRGITCRDLRTGEGFVIGDTDVILIGPSRGTAPSGGTPSYSGPFASVDSLQRCFADDSGAVCYSSPSGMAVRLEPGSGSQRISGGLSTDRLDGGPAMSMGTAFTTPGGRIMCGSSSRGITCSDAANGDAFTIGDHYAILTNNGAAVRYSG